jgi:hypothetical protein
VEEEEGTPWGGGVLPFIGGWKKAAQVVAGGGGEMRGAAGRLQPWLARAAPLFRQCG